MVGAVLKGVVAEPKSEALVGPFLLILKKEIKMAKALKDYTDAELIGIGQTTVKARIAAAEAEKGKRELMAKLLAAYKANPNIIKG